jgi:hypothetical protein
MIIGTGSNLLLNALLTAEYINFCRMNSINTCQLGAGSEGESGNDVTEGSLERL